GDRPSLGTILEELQLRGIPADDTQFPTIGVGIAISPRNLVGGTGDDLRVTEVKDRLHRRLGIGTKADAVRAFLKGDVYAFVAGTTKPERPLRQRLVNGSGAILEQEHEKLILVAGIGDDPAAIGAHTADKVVLSPRRLHLI